MTNELTEFNTTVFGHSASDKMQVLGRGELPTPGACVVCGGANSEEAFLFLGIHVDFHGALILCSLCLIQGAEKIGCMAPTIAARIHEQAVGLAEARLALKKENEELHERLTVFESALRSIRSDSTTDGAHTRVDNPEAEQRESVFTEETQPGITVEQSESSESVKNDGDSEPSRTDAGDITAAGTDKPRVVRRKQPSV